MQQVGNKIAIGAKREGVRGHPPLRLRRRLASRAMAAALSMADVAKAVRVM